MLDKEPKYCIYGSHSDLVSLKTLFLLNFLFVLCFIALASSSLMKKRLVCIDQGLSKHPRDESKKNDVGFLGPSWFNKKVNLET